MRLPGWFVLLALWSGLAIAQSVPDDGLRAEMAGQWTEAIGVYERALTANPAQAHLWERIADIRATRLNDPASAAGALREAIRFAPNDARLHHKLAQALGAAQDGPGAAAASRRAVELAPDNIDYLRTRAEIAAWQGDYTAAFDSYERMLAITPGDTAARLGIARTQHWQGQLDASKTAYETLLAQAPDAAAPWSEYIGVLAELGDYARAMDALGNTRQRFGDSLAYRKQKARILAWADRPAAALALVEQLAPELRDDYELGYTRTIALHHAHRPREALASLDATTRLRPDSKESVDLARFIRTPLRSNATAGFGYQAGSDDISIRHAYLRGEVVINPETRLFGGTDRQRIHAKAGSLYVKPDGGTSIDYSRVWLGVQHRASPTLSLDAQAGGGRAEGDNTFVYEVGADHEPVDALALRLAHRQDLFAVSPRAAKLGIERRATTLDATWTPDLRWTLAGRLGYDTLSDGNDRWEAQFAPRRAVLRSQRLNLDLGVSGRWFGYDTDPNHGYYAPSSYRRYAVTAFTYWKVSDDDGVSVTFSYGPYKDNTMPAYRNGGDVVLEGFFGIYRDWYLNVKAGLSDYGGGATAGYRSNQFELSLTRRF